MCKHARAHAHDHHAHHAAAPPAHPRTSLRTHFLSSLLLFTGIAVAVWTTPILIGSATVEEALSLELSAADLERVEASTFNGAVNVVVAHEGDTTIRIKAIKRASGADENSARADLANVEVTVVNDNGVGRIVARRTGDTTFLGNCGVSLTISIPPGVATSLRTDNGQLSISGVGAAVIAHSSNGAIRIDGAAGSVEARTTNGAINVNATDAIVSATTTDGRVAFSGSLADGKHTFRTTNGAIDIALPVDAQFSVLARTTNGRTTVNYELAESTESRKRTQIEGHTSADAQTTINAVTTNGSVTIQPQAASDAE